MDNISLIPPTAPQGERRNCDIYSTLCYEQCSHFLNILIMDLTFSALKWGQLLENPNQFFFSQSLEGLLLFHGLNNIFSPFSLKQEMQNCLVLWRNSLLNAHMMV